VNAEELDAANIVYDLMPIPPSFGFFKRETEGLIGRTLSPAEAQEAYRLCSQEW
jgi:hypothetical protein